MQTIVVFLIGFEQVTSKVLGFLWFTHKFRVSVGHICILFSAVSCGENVYCLLSYKLPSPATSVVCFVGLKDTFLHPKVFWQTGKPWDMIMMWIQSWGYREQPSPLWMSICDGECYPFIKAFCIFVSVFCDHRGHLELMRMC